MPQVARGIVKERASRLRDKGEVVLTYYLASQRGKEVSVLLEKPTHGRTPQFAEVTFDGGLPVEGGTMVRARIAGHDSGRLIGEVCA